jgi:hypothetical protein
MINETLAIHPAVDRFTMLFAAIMTTHAMVQT